MWVSLDICTLNVAKDTITASGEENKAWFYRAWTLSRFHRILRGTERSFYTAGNSHRVFWLSDPDVLGTIIPSVPLFPLFPVSLCPNFNAPPKAFNLEPSLTLLTSLQNGINRNETALCDISCYLDDAETCFMPLWVLDSFFYISYYFRGQRRSETDSNILQALCLTEWTKINLLILVKTASLHIKGWRTSWWHKPDLCQLCCVWNHPTQ